MSEHKTVGGLLRYKKDWIKGNFQDPQGRYCLVGAIWEVYPYDSAKPYARTLKAIAKLYPAFDGISTLASFNDHPETTFTMVRNVIREAKI